MALSKRRIGDLIKVVDERNTFGIKDIYGLNINKEFMPTVANTDGLDESKYKVVRKNRFAYSGMQTGRDECIRISMYLKESPIVVSPAYTTFEITAKQTIIPTYFFMLFLSKEKDRLGWFYSDGSIRSNLDWERFCDIEINIPDLPTQQKYVDIYKSMVANQQSYERGLEDLKLVCDGYIEDLRRRTPCEKIGPYIEPRDERNTDNAITLFQGVNVDHVFTDPKRIAEDTENGSIVRAGQFAFNKVMKAHNTKLPIALRDGPDCVVSNSYQVFEIINKDKLLPKYLLLWMNRAETQRHAGFISFGTTRDIFSFDDLCEMAFPIPEIELQQSIVEIFEVFQERTELNEKMKYRIKTICPILLKGSLEEGKRK